MKQKFFWNSLSFSMIQQMLAIWSLVPRPFLNPACTSGSSQFTYCWSLAWRILSITLLACEVNAIVRLFEHSLALPFFGIGMKTDLFLWKWKSSLAKKKRITTKKMNMDNAIGLPWYTVTQSSEPSLFTLSRAPASVKPIFYILLRLYLTTSLSCRKIAVFALTTLLPNSPGREDGSAWRHSFPLICTHNIYFQGPFHSF